MSSRSAAEPQPLVGLLEITVPLEKVPPRTRISFPTFKVLQEAQLKTKQMLTGPSG